MMNLLDFVKNYFSIKTRNIRNIQTFSLPTEPTEEATKSRVKVDIHFVGLFLSCKGVDTVATSKHDKIF